MTIAAEATDMINLARSQGQTPRGWKMSREAIGRLARGKDQERFILTDRGWMLCGLPVLAIGQQGLQLSC